MVPTRAEGKSDHAHNLMNVSSLSAQIYQRKH